MNKDEKRYNYLTLVQEPISRMSTLGAIFKGFSATVATGTIAFLCTDIHIVAIVLSAISILALAAMDVYYLRLERKFRGLYKQIVDGKKELDFSISPPKDKCFICRSKARIWDCVKSPSIFIFYGCELIICIATIILKGVL